jgi:hypothetical protein
MGKATLKTINQIDDKVLVALTNSKQDIFLFHFY